MKHTDYKMGQHPEDQYAYNGSPGRREKGIESLFEVTLAEDVPILRKEMDMEIQEAQGTPIGINPVSLKKPTQRHITIKLSKVKIKEFLRTSKEMQFLA